MTFKEFKELQQKHIENTIKDVDYLFEVDVDKDLLWEMYLNSFPAGKNEIYRERREYDCSSCRSFVKHIGHTVAMKDGKITTMWGFQTNDNVFGPVVKALDKLVKSASIKDVFYTSDASRGCDHNHEDVDGKMRRWEHMYFKLPSRFVLKGEDIGSTVGRLRDIRNVFKRSLDEISIDAVLTVLELIDQKSLYKGDEWKAVLGKFLEYQQRYSKIDDSKKDLFCWEDSLVAGPVIGKIRNHSIGTLLVDVSNEMDLNEAVKKYEAIVAPSNYKRPKEIYTKKMLEEAQKTVESLGLMNSLGRRYATLDDITVNNILFSNKDAAPRIQGANNPFEEMSQETAVTPKSFDKVEEISAEDFVKNVLPGASEIEMLVEGKHESNLVSLIAAKDPASPTLFKWGNTASWAYKGNITDSMKERVKSFGGKVDGVLRFSIQWNDNGDNKDDLDAHCQFPGGGHIFFSNKVDRRSGGNLDVDIIRPDGVAVENITWPDLRNMPDGSYRFFVNCYTARGARSGFTAEIEFDDQIFHFGYGLPLKNGENIQVAKVHLKNREFSIKVNSNLDVGGSTVSKEIWGINTNQFVPVTVCMYSPNYWDEQSGIGHKHYFFMLKGCKSDETPNGFFNEYLREDLMSHKRVFAVLGSKMRVMAADDQLSGLGFSSTKRNSAVVKVTGHVRRVMRIMF